MWNNSSHRPAAEYKYLSEVRAFDTGSSSSSITTWHPRTSYTCSFCQREFRSAQALGGHMNVHRRDRARLPQAEIPSSSAGTMIFYSISDVSGPFMVDSPYHQVVVNSPMPSLLLDKVGMFRDCDDDGNDSISESSADGTDLDLELRLGW